MPIHAALWLETGRLSRLPSEYFAENVYVTFQDDYVATRVTHLCPSNRLMWAMDFPHNDGTYPHTQEVIAKLTSGLGEADRARILGGNVEELYGLAS